MKEKKEINWEKIWDVFYFHYKRDTLYPDVKEKIQELVNEELKGELEDVMC